MNMMQNNPRFRILTAVVLLLLFTFTGLFAIHQNGTGINAAEATSSGNNMEDAGWVPDFGCIAAVAACAAALASAADTCMDEDKGFLECLKAGARAILVCADIPKKC